MWNRSLVILHGVENRRPAPHAAAKATPARRLRCVEGCPSGRVQPTENGSTSQSWRQAGATLQIRATATTATQNGVSRPALVGQDASQRRAHDRTADRRQQINTLPTLPSNSGRGALLLANPARAALSGFSSLDGNRLDSC
jgi:hypothetical protein